MKCDLVMQKELRCLNESELITRTQNGDAQAFNPIVRRYQEKVYDTIYRRVRHHETTEDLCQEVFLRAWRALPSFKGGSSFYGWLSRIAVNCSIDFLRRQNREIVFGFTALPENSDDVLDMAWTESSPDELLEAEEFRDILNEGVRRLPSVQRRVFNLCYRDGLRIREIALCLNKPVGTIKAHLYHARRNLRHNLRFYLQEESVE